MEIRTNVVVKSARKRTMYTGSKRRTTRSYARKRRNVIVVNVISVITRNIITTVHLRTVPRPRRVLRRVAPPHHLRAAVRQTQLMSLM